MEMKQKEGAPLARLQRILREARARIARGWTQGHSARDSNGNFIAHDAPGAVRWCLYGAIGFDPCATVALFKAAGRDNLGAWNDATERTQADVFALLDKAIGDAAEPPKEEP